MPQKDLWSRDSIEPSVADMLSDPVVEAMMRADGVQADDVLAAIRQSNRTHLPSSSLSLRRSIETTRWEAEFGHQLARQLGRE